jgi:O-antigen ligase
MAIARQVLGNDQPREEKKVLNGAFFWLSAFYFVYCARPEDWLPGLKYVPLAKITAFFTCAALVMSMGKAKRGLRDLPKEAYYLIIMIGLLLVSALLSPIWKGGAFVHSLDFGKVSIAWVMTFLLVTDFSRLRRVIFIQAASVAAIAIISIVKGHNTPRLDGVLGGIYSNPNDLAFAIVLSLPFCLAFLLTAKGLLRKLAWTLAMLVMAAALFLTASRAGFIDLVISGTVCLWHFGIRGRRPQLIVAAGLALMVLMIAAGGLLRARFATIFADEVDPNVQSAYGSFEERKFLIFKAIEGIEHYPVFGVGAHDFANYSGLWKEVHNAYLQIGVEGGIPVLMLYLAFFGRGFGNLKILRRRRRDLDTHTTLFVGALHSSLIGFVVGALFAPEAYQFFPYFAVAQTSVLVAIIHEQEQVEAAVPEPSSGLTPRAEPYDRSGIPIPVPFVR